MVYNNKFVVVVKVNGKVLRESKEAVYIPFGAEYSITLKNLNSVKAVANISIDGEDVMDSNEVIVDSNSEITLEGFIKNRKVSNKFKFIEKTDTISKYRGDKVSDGLIRVAFKFEEALKVSDTVWINGGWNINPWGDVSPWPYTYSPSKTSVRSSGDLGKLKGSSSINYSASIGSTGGADNISFNSIDKTISLSCDLNENEDGITVKGSESDQTFKIGSVNTLEDTEHIVVIQLKGQTKKNIVRKPITVKTKITCETCGKKSKSNNKFCSRCGTALF